MGFDLKKGSVELRIEGSDFVDCEVLGFGFELDDYLAFAPLDGWQTVSEHGFNFGNNIPEPENIIYNDRSTIVEWSDGEKTVVTASEGDNFTKELGLAYSYVKKFCPNRSKFLKMIKSANVQKTKKEKNKKKEEKKKKSSLKK